MNSRERMLEAMNHGQPDRVPVMCQLALGHYFLNCPYPPHEIWFDSNTFAQALLELQQRYRFDGILVNLPGRLENWRDHLANIRTADQTDHLQWDNGLKTTMPHDDNPATCLADGKPLGRADVRHLDVDDPATYRLPGFVWNVFHIPQLWDTPPDADLTQPADYPPWFTATLAAVRSLAPDLSVHAEVFSPFTMLLELLGYEHALMTLIDNPDLCHRLLGHLTAIAQAQAHLYAQHDPDAILVSSAFAGAGFISRDTYRQFVGPYENTLYQTIHTLGPKAYVHTCGAIGDRLDLMAQTDVDGVDTLDPPPLGTVTLADAKEKYGRRFFLKGNLDAVNELLQADDAAFEAAVKQRLTIGKPGSGYILSTACSVAPRVAPQRLARLTELAEQIGRYA